MHKFINSEFIDQVCDGHTKIKSCHSGEMLLTMAGQTERQPLKEVRLTVDLGGYHYMGWFGVYNLAKYDVNLGKSWMAEATDHVDLRRNILWLGQMALGGQFEHRLDCLSWDEGGPCSKGTTMAVLAKPVSTMREDPANIQDSDGDDAAAAVRY
jgi:hypothetical protein